MNNKRLDKNARVALSQFKYEMANELGLNTNDTKSSINNRENYKNTKKLIDSAENQMGNKK